MKTLGELELMASPVLLDRIRLIALVNTISGARQEYERILRTQEERLIRDDEATKQVLAAYAVDTNGLPNA